jgi:hypothetical protein
MANPCVLYLTAHGIPIGSKFTFTTTGKLPDYLVEGLEYYVITAGYTANSFRFSLTKEGTAVNTSGTHYGVHTIHSVDSDPKIGLDWSDDGGHTWSSRYWISIGMIGQYTKRARWNRLGRSRERIFRVMFSDPVKFVMIGASADIEGLNS